MLSNRNLCVKVVHKICEYNFSEYNRMQQTGMITTEYDVVTRYGYSNLQPCDSLMNIMRKTTQYGYSILQTTQYDSLMNRDKDAP
jgi:hypothetical protein